MSGHDHSHDHDHSHEPKWKHDGVRVISGNALDPKRNLTYKITITVAEKRLTTRGCMIGGLICKNVGWTRAR